MRRHDSAAKPQSTPTRSTWKSNDCNHVLKAHSQTIKRHLWMSRAAPAVLQTLPQTTVQNGGPPKIPITRCSIFAEGLHECPLQPHVGYKRSRHLPRLLTTKTRSALDRKASSHTQINQVGRSGAHCGTSVDDATRRHHLSRRILEVLAKDQTPTCHIVTSHFTARSYGSIRALRNMPKCQ